MALIIDASMPKNCLSCPSKEHCLAFGKLHFNERLKMLDECRRADNCPIIGEIPDKHGDLIDEDEFRQVFYEEMRKHRGNEPIITLIKELLAKADNAPVVVEATE